MNQPVAPSPAAPGAAKRPKPLRIVRGPDGKPRVVRRGAAAFAALQANIPKVLRVGVIQGTRIVEERIVRQRETITVGPSEKNHFVVPHATLSRHPLFEIRQTPKGDQYVLNFTDEMTGRVAFPPAAGGVTDLAAIRNTPRAPKGSRGCQVPLTEECKGKIVIGDTTMLFQFVVPPPIQPPPQLPASVRGGWVERMDPWLIGSLVLAAILHSALLMVALIPDWPAPTLDEILASDYSPAQLVPVEIKEEPPKTEDDKDQEDKDGEGSKEKDQGAEATAQGTETAAVEAPVEGPKPTGPTQPTRTIGGETISERRLADQADKIENALSLQNILGGGSNGPEMGIAGGFDGSSASVANLQDALQGTVGTAEGDGSQGGYTTVAGNLVEGPAVGTVGGDPNAGQPTGPAVVPVREGPEKIEKKEVVKGKVRTSGGAPAGGSGRMSGDVFRATLQRKRGAIEACYNNALVRDPTLGGDLTFLIIINQQGAVSIEVSENSSALDAAGVTSCIVGKLRTMNFASNPPQGGDFRVRLPVSFIAP